MNDDNRDSIMKMLLSSPSTKIDSPSKMYRRSEDGRAYKLFSYLQQLNGQEEEVNPVALDHNYSLPVNNRVENSFAKQAKTLFVPKTNNSYYHSDVGVDTTQSPNKLKPAYDEEKARVFMSETERNLRLLRIERDEPDWDINLVKTDWSTHQTRIFEKAVKILNLDRLARLSHQGSWNEPLLRKIAVNKSARRFRNLLGTVLWQPRLTQWLNCTLLDNLDFPYLVAYIEILQTLKKKLPALVERITQNSTCTKFNQESLHLLLKKPWEPANLTLPHLNPRRLPGNPIMLLVPSRPMSRENANVKMHRWVQHLSLIGQVAIVPTNSQSSKATMLNCLDHMMAATRGKVNEMKSDHAGKHIVLVGINSGAALACQVALCEQVTAVVCLGFPMSTLDEHRGQPDDNILNLNTPVLFVVGQHSSTAQVDDVEDLRERLMIDNSLVIVGEADDHLKIPKSKQTSEGVTQTMVDRCIVEEIADFVSSVLSPPYTSQADKQNRLRAVEKKRRFPETPGNPEPSFQRKQVTMLNTPPPISSVNKQQSGASVANPSKRGRVLTRGGSRIRYTQQSADNLAAISRRTGLSKEVIIAASTQPLGPYNGTEERSSNYSADNSSLVDQLTPDRLLQMPVIFAQEEPTTETAVQAPQRVNHNRQYRTTRRPTVQTIHPRKSSTALYQTSSPTTYRVLQGTADSSDPTLLTFDDSTVFFTDQNQPGSPFDSSVDLDVDLNII